MAKAAAGALITAIIIKLFLFDLVIAEGHSMEPAVRSGALLVVNRLQYGLRLPGGQRFLIRWANPKPGEVVVFYTPGGQLAVKRCGAGAGENAFVLLGDNSLQSLDSRSYGPIRGDDIIGKVLGIR
ncbi:MAG: S26 family signal peptidase [Treponema sp.]|jgi:signal peptidase I|nr:S26 family signal peptidase [Treponema sp.]